MAITPTPVAGQLVLASWGAAVTAWINAATPTAWTAVTFINGWANFDAAHPTQYRKVGDIVEVRGLIKLGTAGTTAFVLPAGFVPYQESTFAAFSSAGAAGLTVFVNGNVTPSAAAGNTYVYLSGVRFSTIA